MRGAVFFALLVLFAGIGELWTDAPRALIPLDGGGSPRLTWKPPTLRQPETIVVPSQTPGSAVRLQLDASRDYIIKLRSLSGPGGLELIGGRNVVLIGGRIAVPDITSVAGGWMGRCITIADNAGTVHVEGVLFVNCGTGVAVTTPRSAVQLQNVRFEDIDSPHDLNHADVIQTWRGPKEIRIDGLTADFSSKGFLWMSLDGTWPQRVDQRRVNFRLWSKGGATPSGPWHFTWHVHQSTRSTCQDCWVEMGWHSPIYRRRLQDGWGTFEKPPDGAGSIEEFIPYRLVGRDGRTLAVETKGEHNALTRNNLGRRPGDYMERLASSLSGERWYFGVPGEGDFVPTGLPGEAYSSPGYK